MVDKALDGSVLTDSDDDSFSMVTPKPKQGRRLATPGSIRATIFSFPSLMSSSFSFRLDELDEDSE